MHRASSAAAEIRQQQAAQRSPGARPSPVPVPIMALAPEADGATAEPKGTTAQEDMDALSLARQARSWPRWYRQASECLRCIDCADPAEGHARLPAAEADADGLLTHQAPLIRIFLRLCEMEVAFYGGGSSRTRGLSTATVMEQRREERRRRSRPWGGIMTQRQDTTLFEQYNLLLKQLGSVSGGGRTVGWGVGIGGQDDSDEDIDCAPMVRAVTALVATRVDQLNLYSRLTWAFVRGGTPPPAAFIDAIAATAHAASHLLVEESRGFLPSTAVMVQCEMELLCRLLQLHAAVGRCAKLEGAMLAGSCRVMLREWRQAALRCKRAFPAAVAAPVPASSGRRRPNGDGDDREDAATIAWGSLWASAGTSQRQSAEKGDDDGAAVVGGSHRRGPHEPPTARWLHQLWVALCHKLALYLGVQEIRGPTPALAVSAFEEAIGRLLAIRGPTGVFAVCFILDARKARQTVRARGEPSDEDGDGGRGAQAAEVGAEQASLVTDADVGSWHRFRCMAPATATDGGDDGGGSSSRSSSQQSRGEQSGDPTGGMGQWPVVGGFPRSGPVQAALEWHRPNIVSLLMERKRRLTDEEGSDRSQCYTLECHAEPRLPCEPPHVRQQRKGPTSTSAAEGCTYWLVGVEEAVTLVVISRGVASTSPPKVRHVVGPSILDCKFGAELAVD
eukprot:COSAG01_NODE_38_length_33931_cov_75.163632_14_plen_675_part_00